MEIFTQAKLNLSDIAEKAKIESSVGEFKKGTVGDVDLDAKLYLEYPGVTELLDQAQNIISSGKTLKFKTKQVFSDAIDLNQESFLNKDPKQNQNRFSGLMAPHFGSLLNSSCAGQKILGNYSLAYIEAKTSKEYFEHFFGNEAAVDHFYTTKGVCNLNTFEEVVKAFDIKKNELAVLLLPQNAVKAFRRGPFSGWQIPEIVSSNSQIGKLHHIDKQTSEELGEIKLVDYKITNLDSPLYKIKIDERSILVVLTESNYQDLQKEVTISLSQESIDSIKANIKFELGENDQEELSCSLGQAVRVVFELFGGDYDAIPELMLNFEGGSWSSIAMENSSSGRHHGTNSMHEVIKNSWYKHPELVVPWNYIAFDRLTETNKYLLENENVYLLSLEHPKADGSIEKINFLECPQAWKKIQLDLIQYVLRFVYKEYANLGSKKFLLSTKELMSTAASFLANLSINNFDIHSQAYNEGLTKLQIQPDLIEFLELIAYVHLFCSSKADFYSSKTNMASIARIKCLATIYKKLDKLSPISSKNFYNKICEILAKDTFSEFTTLLNLFKSEVNKA